MKKVLMIYGTRYGSTREISEKIAEIFREKQFELKLVNISEEDAPSLREYDGVLIGTGIRIGKWTKKIKKFVKKNLDDLNNRDFKLGFYISCGTASKKEKVQEATEKFLLKNAEELGLNLDFYDAFGGTYDLRENSPIGKIFRVALKASLKEEEGWEIVEDKLYDFRDWDQIESFAEKFASVL
ncbi:MAG: flavodoxin domain-containing protein [Promethearchaeota archaeon]